MIDMPVDLSSEMLGNINLSDLSGKIDNLTPVIDVVRQTWDTQTLEQLKEGKVSVPDETINESIAKTIDENSAIKSLQVTSVDDGKMKLTADTKKFGKVILLCRIDQFEHNKDTSVLKFKVLEKDLPDNGTMSWIFSRISLSMAEKFVGKVNLGDTIKTKISGNTVTVDFHDAVRESSFGQAELFGYSLSDAVIVEQAVPKDGYVEFKTALNLPDTVKNMLQNILK
ncbi:MAG: hypothetical protein H6Q70_1594 [Firmicutes bacterium]|jgi:hypothetical protein|nr:hypothetical protein [Bacillota bacterium]